MSLKYTLLQKGQDPMDEESRDFNSSPTAFDVGETVFKPKRNSIYNINILHWIDHIASISTLLLLFRESITTCRDPQRNSPSSQVQSKTPLTIDMSKVGHILIRCVIAPADQYLGDTSHLPYVYLLNTTGDVILLNCPLVSFKIPFGNTRLTKVIN
jgi:hypothetical protein